MKKLFLALLLAAPLYGYDAEAVYADYLTFSTLLTAQNISANEASWVEAMNAFASLTEVKDKINLIQKSLIPPSQKLGAGSRAIRAQLKTAEAMEAFGPALDILEMTEGFSALLLKGFKNSDDAAFQELGVLSAKMASLESDREKKIQSFLKKLRKEMRKAKMPRSAIDSVN